MLLKVLRKMCLKCFEMANQIRVDTITKYKMLHMVQECCQNLQAETFNNRAHVVHFLLYRAEAKEISF